MYLCPSDNALDKRNRAMRLLLARLGLRAEEVFRVSLDNLNWTGGSVLIRSSKTARERILPMPEDVGNSLAAYLTKGRPPSSERLVFLNHHPPYQPLGSTAVLSSFVNSLLRRAGILAPRSGTHVLRHYAGRRTIPGDVVFQPAGGSSALIFPA